MHLVKGFTASIVLNLMTTLPLHIGHRSSHHLHLLRIPPLRPATARLPIMATAESPHDTDDRRSATVPPAGPYPKPLSPPYPALSKEVELNRAMSAAARSAIYALSAGDIVFEDEWLVVANKPSGIYCETLLSSVSPPPGATTVQPELHLANRLDRDTSGLMVITKSHKVAAKLVKAFTDHKVKKTYLALCVGAAPNWDKIRISSGHGRSKFGAWRVYSASDVGRTLPGGSMVKHMVTSFEVLSVNSRRRIEESAELNSDGVESVVVEERGDEGIVNGGEKQDEVFIRAYPQSGRTHQIRLHCQYLGVPIKGDVKYGGVHQWKGMTCDTHALHAESLSFEHPVTGVPVQFRAPLPLWASKICEAAQQDS